LTDIIIGNCIGALRHSFHHGTPLFMNGEPPFTFSEDREEWDKLYACLSLKGLVPFGDIMSTVTVLLDENTVEARTRGVKRYFEYDNLWIYNDENVGGLEFHIQEENDEFDVYDIFHIKNVQPSTLTNIKQGQDFMKEMFTFSLHRETFYCSLSRMTGEQLSSTEYSEPIVRLSMFDILSENGVLGSKNGQCKKTGNIKRISIKLDHRERNVRKAGMNKYSDIKGVHFRKTFNKLSDIEYNLLDEPLKPFSGNNPYLQKRDVLRHATA
tara:strand:+ start:1129 stop:1932 length:804 start_codon:yes stop_codon:yes gene_type:complete